MAAAEEAPGEPPQTIQTHAYTFIYGAARKLYYLLNRNCLVFQLYAKKDQMLYISVNVMIRSMSVLNQLVDFGELIDLKHTPAYPCCYRPLQGWPRKSNIT